MKTLLFIALWLVALVTHAANPSFDSFHNTNDFRVIPPYIELQHSGGSNSFSFTTNIYNNSYTVYSNSTIIVEGGSTVTITNSTFNFNGTNVATINPTIGRIPYNFNNTNLYDSALYFIDTNTVGADAINTFTLGVSNLTSGVVISIPTGGGYGVLTNVPNASGTLTNDGAGNFGWGPAGITINPTDNYLPYRSDATTLADSFLYQTNSQIVSTATVQFYNGGSGPQIVLGDLSASFPGFKRLGNAVAVKLGDDSGYTDLIGNIIQGESQLLSKIGSTGSYAIAPGRITIDNDSIVSSTTNTSSIFTNVLGGNSLFVNGDKLRFRIAGVTSADSNAKQIQIKFGATTIFDTGTVAFNNASWVIDGEVARVNATTQRANVLFTSSSASLSASARYSTPGETLSGDIEIVVLGGAFPSGSITQTMFQTDYSH